MRERTFRWTDPRELSRLAFNQGGIEWPIVEALAFGPEELEDGRIVFSMRALHVGNAIGTAEGRVYDARGNIVAHGSATMAILETDRMRAASLPNS